MTLGLAIRMGLAPRRPADGRAATGIGIQWVCSGQVLYSVSVVIKKKNSVYSPIPVVVSSFSRKRRPVQCSARTGPRRPGNTSGPEVCRCETEQRRSDDAVPPGPAKGYAGRGPCGWAPSDTLESGRFGLARKRRAQDAQHRMRCSCTTASSPSLTFRPFP